MKANALVNAARLIWRGQGDGAGAKVGEGNMAKRPFLTHFFLFLAPKRRGY